MHISNRKNRRKYTRTAWSAPAVILTDGRLQDECRTIDVSRGGALLSVVTPVEPGTPIQLKLKVGRFEIGPQPARVVRNSSAFWGRTHLLAVEFDHPSSALMDAVNHCVRRNRWD